MNPRNGSKRGPEPDSTMTVAEVSNYLSLSASSVYRLTRDLKAVRVAGRWAFRTGDVEQWLLQRREENEPQIEPVEELGSQVRLFSHMDEKNIFLDVPEAEASRLIRRAIQRAVLSLADVPEAEAKEQLCASVLEREELCSTALHPAVAFPHPRDPETGLLARDQILIVRAAQPVEFRESHGYRPRIVFLLLARTVSLQLRWEARLSHLLHQPGFVDKLLSAQSPRQVHQIFAASN